MHISLLANRECSSNFPNCVRLGVVFNEEHCDRTMIYCFTLNAEFERRPCRSFILTAPGRFLLRSGGEGGKPFHTVMWMENPPKCRFHMNFGQVCDQCGLRNPSDLHKFVTLNVLCIDLNQCSRPVLHIMKKGCSKIPSIKGLCLVSMDELTSIPLEQDRKTDGRE